MRDPGGEPTRWRGDARLIPDAVIQPRLADEQRRFRVLHDDGLSSHFRRQDGTGAWLNVSADDEASGNLRLGTPPFGEIGIMAMGAERHCHRAARSGASSGWNGGAVAPRLASGLL
jgi:hypothetical protein